MHINRRQCSIIHVLLRVYMYMYFYRTHAHTHTHTHTHVQASELSEIVGKAFKATFAKQTLTRDKKKKKEKSGGAGGGGSSSSSGSSSPWTVVNHSQPSSSGSTGATSSENSAPSPSAPPVQRQPWTVQVQQTHIMVSVDLGAWGQVLFPECILRTNPKNMLQHMKGTTQAPYETIVHLLCHKLHIGVFPHYKNIGLCSKGIHNFSTPCSV